MRTLYQCMNCDFTYVPSQVQIEDCEEDICPRCFEQNAVLIKKINEEEKEPKV